MKLIYFKFIFQYFELYQIIQNNIFVSDIIQNNIFVSDQKQIYIETCHSILIMSFGYVFPLISNSLI